MLVAVLLFILGLALLIKGGDWFVDGACGIARRFRLPEILIGATVVSIGTTLPEVMVSATSAVMGQGEMAYGNAIGSIICNTALIAAITVTVRPCEIDRHSLVLPVSFFFVSAAFYVAVSYIWGYFYRWVGIVLVLIFTVYMVSVVLRMKKTPMTLEIKEEDIERQRKLINDSEYRQLSRWGKVLCHIRGRRLSVAREIILLVVGAAVIALGADLLVDNGTLIATELGVPQSVIALTFVALGTSLPELVTAITSLIKGHGSLSLGNIIGANLFNLVLVSGVSVVLSPFEIPSSSILFGHNASLVLDIPVMLTVMLLLTVPALIGKKLYRSVGILLLLIYAAFCTVQFVM